ncbi:MAG: PEP-CTERM sorting domain-containing protein [Nitrosospira sp.]|nr:PEP-CTERM sorting domain-containing protein [Nitrosospira sp.]
MLNKEIRVYAAMVIFALGGAGISSASTAALLTASAEGVPVGAGAYESFDGLGAAGGAIGNGMTVTFSGTGAGAVAGLDAPGFYAAPFISGGNGTMFGNPQGNGQNQTQYLTTGIGQVTMELDDYHQYFGLLWGSVDHYNSLSFYDGTTLLFNFTGLDVDGIANGNQGASGTLYVNIESDTPFNRVVASSTEYGFEFDNVALSVNPISDSANPASFPVNGIPEPGTLALLGLGLIASMVTRNRRAA